MTTNSTETTMTLTETAVETINAMQSHVGSLARHYGVDSTEHKEASRTLLGALAGLFQWRDLSVWRDGDLSLCANTANGFTFGVIFHAVKRSCTNEGCTMYASDNGDTWSYMSGERRHDCGSHAWSYPLDAPAPGTWSFHS